MAIKWQAGQLILTAPLCRAGQAGAVEVAFYQPEPFLEKVKVAEVIAPFATPSLHNRGPLPSTESGKGEG